MFTCTHWWLLRPCFLFIRHYRISVLSEEEMEVLFVEPISRVFKMFTETTGFWARKLTDFQFCRTKLTIYLHCSGIEGSSVIDDMPSAYQALPEVSEIEGQHNTSKQTVWDRSWGWQCVAGAEHGSWSCHHTTDKASRKCTAKKDYLWVAQCVWHQACWVK